MRRDRLALVGELVGDVSHDCNNQLAFVLSNLQNLAEYADDLARLVGAYRARIRDAGLRDASLARMETDMDLEFVLEDAGRAAREGLEGASRLREVLRTLARLGTDEPNEPQLIDLAKTVHQAASFQTKTIGIRAQLRLNLLESAPVLAPASAVMRAVVVLIKNALAAFGDRSRSDNHLAISLERTPGGYILTVAHDGTGPGIGIELAQSAAAEIGGRLAIESGRTTLFVPEVEA